MTKKLKISIIVLVSVILIYLLASPYWAIYKIRQAIIKQDSVTLARYIDFPSVRQDMKDQFKAQIAQKISLDSSAEGGFAALGTLLASSMADKMVDVMVSPQGLTLLLQGKKLKQQLEQAQPLPTESEQQMHLEEQTQKISYHSHYESFNQLAVELYAAEQHATTTVILQRQGLSWKVTQIQLPMQQLQ